MTHQHTTPRILSILILFGLVIAQLGAVQPARAAADALTITWGLSSYPTMPGQKVTLDLTENITTGMSFKANESVDTWITLTASGGTDLTGLAIQAYNTTGGGTPVFAGTYTLPAGKTSFWLSTFGGGLARKKATAVEGSSFSYQLAFTPSQNMAGLTISVDGQIFIGHNKYFGYANPPTVSGWKTSSAKSSTAVVVTAPPNLSSTDLGGPYITGIERTFQIVVHNAAAPAGTNYSNLHMKYSIGNDTTNVPSITSFQYSVNGDPFQPVGMTSGANGISGEIGPDGGFALAAGATVTFQVKLVFGNHQNCLFPFSLSLEESGQTAPVASLTSFAAVNPAGAELASSGIQADYMAGIQQEFHVIAVNPNNGEDYSALIRLSYTVAAAGDISKLEYYTPASDTWTTITPTQPNATTLTYTYAPAGGFSFNHGTSLTVKFRITFARPGDYPVQAVLVKQQGGSVKVTMAAATAHVASTPPIIDLSDLVNQIPLTAGTNTPTPFTVIVSNPSTGKDYLSVRLNFTIQGAALADIAAFEYYRPSTSTWIPIAMAAGAGGVTGFVPQDLPLMAPATDTYQLRINFINAGSYTLKFDLVDPAAPAVVIATQSASADTVPYLPVTGDPTLYLPVVNK